MITNYISITYAYNYVLNFAENYAFTKCKKCINLKTNREIKKVYNNGCIGYNINGKFYSLTELRKHLKKIEIINCPF
jgi:hypothetical protein